jgi:hypothetical protein
MRSIIKQIFGERKEKERVSRDDIKKLIEEWKIKESDILEYKSTERLRLKNGKLVSEDKPGEDKKEEILIKPLVAFLNKHQPEGGLLIWGIRAENGIPTNLAALPKATIKKEDIERWIYTSIYSVPTSLIENTLDIEIEEVEVEDKSVFLIEIHPRDFNVVYVSRITERAYLRVGDHSKDLSFFETYELIERKILPKVFIIFEKEAESYKKLENEKVEIKVRLSYLNEGHKPGEWVKTLLNIKIVEGEKLLKINTNNIPAFDSRDEPKYAWNTEIQCPEDGLTFQINNYFKEVIYPFVPHDIGILYFEFRENVKIKISINTYEYRGLTTQTLFLSSGGELREEIKTFVPYIALSEINF